MYQFTIQLAGLNIEINSLHTRVMAINRRFITNEKPDFKLVSNQLEIDREKERYIQTVGYRNDPWDGFIELSSVLRSICIEIIDFGVIMMHGAAIANGQSSYLFTAPSGTGKTTHVLKWIKHIPDAFVVNGDKPFIKIPKDGSQPLACGSPWSGKENMYTNAMVPLKSIILMERAQDNYIEHISFIEAFPFLYQQIYHPDDEDKMRKTIHLIQHLNPAVTFWRFRFNNFKDDCFDVAYNALVKNQL